MIRLFCALIFLAPILLIAQHKDIHSQDYYKDRSIESGKYFPDGLYPKNDSEFDLIQSINDSSKQYYTLIEILFKKHLIEIKGVDYVLHISPIIDFSIGSDLSDTSDRTLFRNTRGFFVEGDLGKNFSFSSEFHENQARFANYQNEFFNDHGELYDNETGYYQQNAVIPGEARTKPFKTDSFDFAYAVGSIRYRPIRSVLIHAGNSSHFVGDGFRSLLLSDQNGFAPFISVNWKISQKLRFTYLRSRHLNLLRRPLTSSAESYYEPKGFGMNYLTYEPLEGLGISLFEGNHWSRGDSTTSYPTPALAYNPIPFTGSLIVNDPTKMHTIWGMNISARFSPGIHLYGQLVIDDLAFEDLAWQIGCRSFDFLGLKNLQLQAEYNFVPKDFYRNQKNERLNYSHYNLPLAHIFGNGFSEILFRSTYDWSRFYGELILNYSDRMDQMTTPLLGYRLDNYSSRNSVFYTSLEVGYRFNQKMNLCAFLQTTYRTESSQDRQNMILQFGLRTSIRNKALVF